jgi:hypothetical protein
LRTPSVFNLPLAELQPADPFRWLQLGWQDFRRCPRIGLFYGLCFFAMGHALLAVFQNAPAYVLALSAGFPADGAVPVPGPVRRQQGHAEGVPPAVAARLAGRLAPTKGTMASLPVCC